MPTEKALLKTIRNILVTLFLTVCLNGYSLTGTWRGDLNLGQIKLALVFNFTENPDGKTECTLDVPAQGAKNIPASVDLCTADSVAITVKAVGASYQGKITGNEIQGVFSQLGHSFNLTLTPEKDLTVRRPQTPRPPFPYKEIDTTFVSTDGTLLSGTLVLPPTTASKKIPAIIMVTGSGPQNRDEEFFEHKPFAVIADNLARNGIASFRYDDRGINKSKGNFSAAVFSTFKDDASSALAFLKSFPEIGKAGILGHSEGGTIALMLASENVPDFVISLAGMAVSGKECIIQQNDRALDKQNISGAEKEESLRLISACFDYLIANGNNPSFDVDAYIQKHNLHVPAEVTASIKANSSISNEWFTTFLQLTPKNWLGKIKVPVLALNGTVDTQVEANSNLDVIRKYVRKAETVSYPGLNHLFQHATTGEVSEYGEITETISPEVLSAIVSFIQKQ